LRENKAEILQKELDIVKYKQTSGLLSKESHLKSKERDLEISQRLIDEQRIEFSYKRDQLNDQIKGQLVWPLNALESDTKLMQRFKDFKI
jgi:hypothetical protein